MVKFIVSGDRKFADGKLMDRALESLHQRKRIDKEQAALLAPG